MRFRKNSFWKRTVCLVILALVCVCVCASEVLPGEKRKASTEHFDIIYPVSHSASAAVLLENCENIYASLVELFLYDPEIRIPVVLSDRYKESNAYFTAWPSNMIVLYDTSSMSTSLFNMENSLLDTFRHELTHAFNYNIKTPALKVLSKIFGDGVTAGPLLYESSFFMEGISVYSESMGNGGRLNDSSALHILKQAKIEGKFPSWTQASGARDTYPYGRYTYIFGGAFLEYLARTYGQDTLTEYFRQAGGVHFFKLAAGLFKDVFKEDISGVWADFEADIAVPQNVAFPDTVYANGTGISDIVFSGGFWYVYDGAVRRWKEDLSDSATFLRADASYGALSVDESGRLLVAQVLSEKSRVMLVQPTGTAYGKTLHTFTSKTEDFKGGCFAAADGREYIVTFSSEGQNSYLTVWDARTYIQAGPRIDLGYDCKIFSMCTAANGYAVFVLSRNTQDCIILFDPAGLRFFQINNPDGVKIRSVSSVPASERLNETIGPAHGSLNGSAELVLLFSYSPADPKSPDLMRAGLAEISLLPDGSPADTVLISYSRADVSGGVFLPAMNGSGTVLFSAWTSRENKLCTTDITALDFAPPESVSLIYAGTVSERRIDETTEKPMYYDAGTGAEIEGASAYIPLKNIMRGTFLPFGVSGGFDVDNPVIDAESLGLGLTWTSADPTLTSEVLGSAGWVPFTKRVFASVQYSDSSLIPAAFNAGFSFPTGSSGSKVFYFSAKAGNTFTLRHSNNGITLYNKADFTFTDGVFDFLNTAYAAYTEQHRTGLGYFDIQGYTAGLRLYTEFFQNNWYFAPEAVFSCRFARLLPFSGTGTFVYNLPLTISASAMWNVRSNTFDFVQAANLVLFSWEIQDKMPALPLFFQRITLEAAVTNVIEVRSGSHADAVSLAAGLYFWTSPFIGSLSRIRFKLGPRFTYNFSTRTPAVSFYITLI